MKVFFIGVVLYTAYIALPAHAAIVVNGSMTDVGGDYNTVNGIVPASWTEISFTSPDTFDENTDFSNFAWNPSSDGGTFVHLLAGQGQFFPNEGVFQDISGLTIGESYIVSFEQSISFSSTGLQGSGGYIEVTFGGETRQSANMSRPGVGVKFDWENQDMIFTATEEMQRLTFLAVLDPDDPGARVDLGLDGVSISAIPIPAAFWLFGSALAGMAGIASRKPIRRWFRPQIP